MPTPVRQLPNMTGLKSAFEKGHTGASLRSMRRTATQEESLTGEHFLTYRAEASAGADGPYWIRRVPRPILMLLDRDLRYVAANPAYMARVTKFLAACREAAIAPAKSI